MKKKIVIAAVCSAALFLTGCVALIASSIDKENMLGPDEGVLVYGGGKDLDIYYSSDVIDILSDG